MSREPASQPTFDGNHVSTSLLGRLRRLFARLDPWTTKRRLGHLERQLAGLEEGRLGRLEQAQSELRNSIAAMFGELERLRDEDLPRRWQNLDQRYDRLESTSQQRLLAAEQRLDQVEQAVRDTHQELSRTRKQLLDRAAERCREQLGCLAGELADLGRLVDRILVQRPLPVPALDTDPDPHPAALDEVQPLLVETFRGSQLEISRRLEPYLKRLQGQAPVLDLGSGRGELLSLLGTAGIAATGVEGDPALADLARRRGLEIIDGDVLAVLREQKDGVWGAVTAIHLMEHLPPAVLLQVLKEIRRALRPGGLLLIESPNPHTLRVGASFYWLDPTHNRPLLPETLTLFLKASGFTVAPPELLHPFPEEQWLAADSEPLAENPTPELASLHRQLEQLRHRLDHLINGPRDFFIQGRASEARLGPSRHVEPCE